MGLQLRAGAPADAAECGRICFEAFKAIADRHHFPRDFPSAEAASGLMSLLLSHPKFYKTVAEFEGRVVGSNFLDERSDIAGVEPISVDPQIQGKGAGRRLMAAVLDRAQERRAPGVRLVQAAYNNQTISLYSKLGFRTREPLSLMGGSPPQVKMPGYEVRTALQSDVDRCNELCHAVHGHTRAGEIEDGVRDRTATVVEHLGRVIGYATNIGFFFHAVSETNDGMKALIGAVKEIAGPGILVPTRNHDLFTWCLGHKMKLVQQMTLMTIGLYSEPLGTYLPSVLY